jgi:hypothetical protein
MYASDLSVIAGSVNRFSKAVENAAAILADAIKYHADATRTAFPKPEVPKLLEPTCAACGTFMVLTVHEDLEAVVCPNPNCPEKLNTGAE